MKLSLRQWSASLLFAATALGFTAAAQAQTDQQKLVNAADTTLSNFMRDPEMT